MESLYKQTPPTTSDYHRRSGLDNPNFTHDSSNVPINVWKNKSVSDHATHTDPDPGNHLIFNTLRTSTTSNGHLPQNGPGHVPIPLAQFGSSAYAQTLRRKAAYATVRGRSNPLATTVTRKSLKKLTRQSAVFSKQDAISFLDIETDKVSSYQYRPGEEVTGKLTIAVNKSVEVSCVELVVKGEGQISVRQSQHDVPRPLREVYLRKELCILGSRDGHAVSVLTSGLYHSQFRVKLPQDLPSTVNYEDSVHGFTFQVAYTVKLRVCDRGHSRSQSLKVLLEKQIPINIERGFDLATIPDATSPIHHKEQVFLACAHQQAAQVSVSVDRAVCLAGDDIRLQIRTTTPTSQSIQNLTCKLQQRVVPSPKHEPLYFTISKKVRENPTNNTANIPNQVNVDVTMATSIELLSPYSLGNSKMKVDYFLAIELKFVPAGGKLSFKVPLGIGPCAEPIYAERGVSKKTLPVFNKVLSFPFFSARSLKPPSAQQPPAGKKSASVRVTSTYSNGLWARCFLCCVSARDIS